jgi:hypothetical protein
MDRLAETFGAHHYSPERTKIIWREVGSLSGEWLQRVMDKFIGEFRQPPLIQEFRNEIAIERERVHQTEKKQHQNEAAEFFRTPPEKAKEWAQQILKNIRGLN